MSYTRYLGRVSGVLSACGVVVLILLGFFFMTAGGDVAELLGRLPR